MGVAVITKYQNVQASLTWVRLKNAIMPDQNSATSDSIRIGEKVPLKQYALEYPFLFITSNLNQPGKYTVVVNLFDSKGPSVQIYDGGIFTFSFTLTLGIYHTDSVDNPNNSYMCRDGHVLCNKLCACYFIHSDAEPKRWRHRKRRG